ncbi:MAG: hypothetical protein BZY88_07195 [SAR202 cluster bacterium Io17-Chloro-G9]|nr:MAG: hypothetical protein BZY88_07195 [SAR202 cluster bacterium Io17-Chloro-G9]
MIKEVIRPDYSAELVYNYVAPARNAPLIKNHQSGRDLPWEERNWSIMAPNGPLTPRHDDNGFLDMDYLLITRLPSGAVGVGDVILIGGTHGSGTQAIDLFLEKLPLEKVEEIVDKLSGSDYYQVLLEVRDITHEDRHSTGHDIRLVDCHSLKVVYN